VHSKPTHHDLDAREWRTLSASAPVAPSPADPMAPWKNWCAMISIADGVAHAFYQLITTGKIKIPDGILPDLRAGLYALNEAFVQVDDAFTQYINSGDASVFDITPPPVAPWPDPDQAPSHTDVDYFEAGFEALGGALTLLSGKIQSELGGHPELKVVYDALAVLVTKEQSIIDAVKKVSPT
jgi:hypothetical protein